MTDEDKLTIEFFKNGSAQRVLRRFEFSEAEKKLVEDAIRSAQRANPRMKIIYEADELLKRVAKTRKPIVSEKLDEQEFAKANAKVVSAMPEKTFLNKIPQIILFLFFALPIPIIHFLKHQNEEEVVLHSFLEARKICEKQGKVLPKGLSDLSLRGIPIFSDIWAQEKNVLSLFGKESENRDVYHRVVCIEPNEQ